MVLMRRAPHESSTRPTTEPAKTDDEYYSGAITATTTTLVLASELGVGYSTSSSNTTLSVIEVDREEEEEVEEGEEDYDAWTLHGSPPTVTHTDEGRQLWNTTTTISHESCSVTVDMLESLEMDDMIIEPRMVTASTINGGRGENSVNLPEDTITAFGNDWDDDSNVVVDGTTTTTTAWKTSSYSSGNGNRVLGDSSWSSSCGRDEDYCEEEY
jgi:hypothetical protein